MSVLYTKNIAFNDLFLKLLDSKSNDISSKSNDVSLKAHRNR